MNSRTLLLGIALLLASSASAQFVDLEKAVEAERLELLLDSTQEGVATAHGCIGCPVQVQVSPQTLYYVDGKKVDAERARHLSGKPATLIHDLEGKSALRILW